MTGLSINQDIGSALVTLTGIDRQKLKNLQKNHTKTCKRKKEPDLDLKISNPEKDIIIPFKKNQQLIVHQ